jgi:hypothetical protein
MKNHHQEVVVFHIMTTIAWYKIPHLSDRGRRISGGNECSNQGGIDYSLIVHHLRQECKKKITPTSKKVRVGKEKR